MKKLAALLSAAAIATASAPISANAVSPKMGDVDRDGKLTAIDALEITKYYSAVLDGQDPSSPDFYVLSHYYYSVQLYGDYNGDGLVNACDASDIVGELIDSGASREDIANDVKAYIDAEYACKLGDVNGDDIVDASDAGLILKYYGRTAAGLGSEDVEADSLVLKRGDFNGDGHVNASDAMDVLNAYAEKMKTNRTVLPK